MHALFLLLLSAVAAKQLEFRDGVYQIQGVAIQELQWEQDDSKHGAYARRKREAVEAVAEEAATSITHNPAVFDAHIRTRKHSPTSYAVAPLQQPLLAPQQLIPQYPQPFQQPPQFIPNNLPPLPLQRLPVSIGVGAQSAFNPQFGRLPPPPPYTDSDLTGAPGSFRPSPPLQLLREQQLVANQRPSPLQPGLPKTRNSNSGVNYYYPPRHPLPLPKCFHNPTGYVCCNEQLNDLIVDTYTNLESRPKFHACNVQLIATHLQMSAQKTFNTSFETLVGYEDFAQKIHFRGDMVCKVELGGRYMLAYATASDNYNHNLHAVAREKREVAFNWGSALEDAWTSIHSTFV